MMHKTGKVLLFAWVLALSCPAAVEYFVATDGCDENNDGLSAATAFASLQRGVDALSTGDTLTLLPGEYFGTASREGLGGMEAVTTIRAALPGTALLRGDVAAPRFSPLEGYRFVYVADFDRPVQAVNERDTLTILESVTALTELEFVPGGFYHDEANGRLYISTSDMAPAADHEYSVSVLDNHGLYLEQPVRVVIDGLAATGFNSAALMPDYPGYRTAWGIIIGRGTECLIRNCTAFFNGGGIGLFTARFNDRGQGNRIEDCSAWANYSRYSQEGGNILAFWVNDDVISNCYAHSGGRHGIRLYGGVGPGLLENCLAWGNAGGTEGAESDLFIKGGVLDVQGRALNCVAVGAGHVQNIYNSLIGGHNAYHREKVTPPDTIRLVQEQNLDRDVEFADPHNFDFRLQADSRFRGTGPDGTDRGPFPYEPVVAYVSPAGDDSAAGHSLRQAWQSIARAVTAADQLDTIYLTADIHRGDLAIRAQKGDRPLFVRGRGEGNAVIDGNVRIEGSGPISFERIRFTGKVVLSEGSDVAFINCKFDEYGQSLLARAVDGLRIEHCAFPAGGIVLAGCRSVWLSGNAFSSASVPAVTVDDVAAILYSDYNGYAAADAVWLVGDGDLQPLAAVGPAFDRHSVVITGEVPILTAGPLGRAIGNWRYLRQRPLRVAGPFVHATSDSTADIEWWTSAMTDCLLTWVGPDGEENQREFQANGFTSFSLTSLQPDSEYTFRVAIGEPFEEVGGGQTGEEIKVRFRTAAAASDPVTWYVAIDGDDRADGRSRDSALRTLNAAAARAGTGDTVLIGGGSYSETVRVRSTGTAGRPVTFRSVPGEKVVFDGDGRALDHAFIVTGKDAVHIDGFYFTGFGAGGYRGAPYRPGLRGVIMLYQTSNTQITRCFKDGRGGGYSPAFIGAWQNSDLLIQNCVITVGFLGLNIASCPGLRIENCVFLRNMIQAMVVVNSPDQPFHLERSIITDSGSNKVRVTLLEIGRVESFYEKDNCYVLRVDDEQRQPFMFYGDVAYARAAAPFDLPDDTVEMQLTDLTRMSVADFQQRFGATGSVVASRVFAVEQDMPATNPEGQPVFLPDRVIGIRTLDFPDLFTADPELKQRGIGLQPEVFKDFHFNSD